MIILPIRELSNPLEGMFDLSRCGDRGKYLSISTGYRKEKKPENTNKLELWIAPRFLIEKEINSTAAHFKPIMSRWNPKKAPIGLFWTWGGWAADYHDMDYLTNQSMDEISNNSLYEKGSCARMLGEPRECAWVRPWIWWGFRFPLAGTVSCSYFSYKLTD